MWGWVSDGPGGISRPRPRQSLNLGRRRPAVRRMPVRRTLMPVVEPVAIQEAKLEVQGTIEHLIALGDLSYALGDLSNIQVAMVLCITTTAFEPRFCAYKLFGASFFCWRDLLVSCMEVRHRWI